MARFISTAELLRRQQEEEKYNNNNGFRSTAELVGRNDSYRDYVDIARQNQALTASPSYAAPKNWFENAAQNVMAQMYDTYKKEIESRTAAAKLLNLPQNAQYSDYVDADNRMRDAQNIAAKQGLDGTVYQKARQMLKEYMDSAYPQERVMSQMQEIMPISDAQKDNIRQKAIKIDKTAQKIVLPDNFSVNQIKGEIARAKQAGDQDRVDLLERIYAQQNYSLENEALSMQDRQQILKEKEAWLNSKDKDRERAELAWLSQYEQGMIADDETNSNVVKDIKEKYGYDLSEDWGNPDSERRKYKALELRSKYFSDRSFDEDHNDYVNAIIDKFGDYGSEIYDTQREIEKYKKYFPTDAYYENISDPEYKAIVDAERKKRGADYFDKNRSDSDVGIMDMDKLTLYTKHNRGELDEDNSHLSPEEAKRLNDVVAEMDIKTSNGQYTRQETDMYYYILATQGEKPANEYLDSLQDLSAKRQTEQSEKETRAITKKANELTFGVPVMSTLSIPVRWAGDAIAAVDNAFNLIQGKDINPYGSAQRLARWGDAVVAQEAQHIDEITGGFHIGNFTAGDIYQAVLSAEESAAGVLLLGPAGYAAVASTSAFRRTAEDIYERGGTPGQVAVGAIVAGFNEYFFEKVSLDLITEQIIGKLSKKSVVAGIFSQFLNGGVEASEEMLTSLANNLYDYINMREKSEKGQLVQKYIDQGYNKEEAEKMASNDLIQQIEKDGISGFISGFLFGTPAVTKNIVNTIQENRQTKAQTRQIGGQIIESGNTSKLIQQANETGDKGIQRISDKAAKQYEKYKGTTEAAEENAEVEPSRKFVKTAGELYRTMQERNVENIVVNAKEVESTVSKMVEDATGEKNADAVSAIVKSEFSRGEDLTAREQRALESPEIQKIVQENQGTFAEMRQNAEQAEQKLYDTGDLLKSPDEYDSFDISKDKNNYLNGQAVDLQKITNVSREDMDIATTGGEAKTSQIEFADKNVATLLRGALDIQNSFSNDVDMMPEFVDSVLNIWKDGGYTDGDLGGFLRDVEGIYRAANTNTEYIPETIAPEYASILQKDAQGVKTANIEAKNAKIAAARTGTRRQGAVIFEGANGTNITVNSVRDIKRQGISLNGMQETGIEAVISMAKATGITFRFFKSELKDGRFVSDHNNGSKNSPNGFYKNGEIYIDINAGANGEGLILFTASHELVHFMRDFAPEQFDGFAKYLFDNYAKKGLSVRQAVHREMMMHQKLKYDEAYEEVVARLSESFLRDAHLTEKSRELYNTDKNIWEKVRDGLKSFVDRIEKYFAGVSPDSDLGKIGAVMARENRDILDRFVAGIREAADNAAYIENTTDEVGDSRMEMARETDYSHYNEPINARDISVLHDIGNIRGRLSVIDFSTEELKATQKFAYQLYKKLGVKSPFFRAWFGDWRANETEKTRKAIAPATQQIKSAGKAVNKDTQLTISWGDTFFKETAGHQWKNDLSMNLRSKIKQIIEESVYLNTRISTNDSKSKMPYTALMHDFYFIAQEGKQRYLYKFYVEEALSNNEKTVFNRAYEIKSIKKIADITSGVHPNGSLTDVISTTIYSIADLYEYVNEYDEDFNPKSASKVVDNDGKPLVVYHGTSSDFEAFDRNKIGDNYGELRGDTLGFYFTPYESDARSYAANNGEDKSKQRVISAYLSLENPLIVKDSGWGSAVEQADIRHRDLMRWAKEGNHDGIIVISTDEIMDDGNPDTLYIAFSPEQIKSVDNIGTFDRSNAKYKYDSREDDLIDDDLLFSEYTDIGDVIKRQYTTHSEAIGEVLKNTADIDIAAGKVKNIVSRLMNSRFTGVDADTKKKLATMLHLELENVKNVEPEQVTDRMIDAVRNVIKDAKVEDPTYAALYDDFKTAFSGKYYLTDEQLADLNENGYTLNDFKKAMSGIGTVVDRNKADKSITGGIKGASQLSFEGFNDYSESSIQQLFGINPEQWDEFDYHAPVMMMDAISELKEKREVPLSKMASADDIDYIATQIAAQFTGAVIQEKYNSRRNPYVRDLVDKFEQRKKDAVKKRNEYYQGKMKELREQRDRKIAEQQKKYQTAREEATVRRKRAEFRERIRKIHKALTTMALNPKVNKYIPKELMDQSIDVLNAVNLDSGISGYRADQFRSRLAALSDTLRGLKSDGEVAEINEAIADMLKNVSERVGDTPLGKMSLEQLKMVHDALKAVQTNIKNRVEVIGADKTRYVYDVAFKFIKEIDDAKIRKILGSKYFMTQLSPERFFNLICGGAKNNAGLEIYQMLNDGQLKMIELETRFTRMFEPLLVDRTATEWAKDIKDKGVKALRKEANTLKDIVDIGLVDEFGNKVKITRGMMLSLYMHLMNEDNIRHVMGGGLTIPFNKKYYEGNREKSLGNKSVRVADNASTARDIIKKINELHNKIQPDMSYQEKQKIWDDISLLEEEYDREVARGIKEYINPMRTRIEKQLTEYDKEWIKTAKQFFDVESKNELNKVTYELYGFEKAVVKNYFPIWSNKDFTEQKFESIVKNMNLENMDMMKSRVRSANPIYLADIADVINKQISNVSQYCGLVIPLANVKRILNAKSTSGNMSVMDTLSKYNDIVDIKKGQNAKEAKNKPKEYIEKLLGDIVGANKEKSDGISNLVAKARHGIAGASLTMNLKVAMQQAASFPTAAAELGYTSLAKALVKGGKNNWALSRADKELIYKYSPLLAYRSMGYSSPVLGDLKDSKGLVDKVVNNSKFKWAFGWIQAFDSATVGRLWYASQYYVDKQSPNLKKGTDEYYKEVARVFNNVVERTQPNYTVMQRPELLRSTNSVVKMFTMFMTQRLQNFNIIYDAGITLSKMKSDFKNGKNGVTIEDVKQAKGKMARAITSQVLVATPLLVAMKFIADAIWHKMDPWRDEDEEITLGSVGLRALSYYLDAISGSVMYGSELYGAIASLISGATWHGVSVNGIETLQDFSKSLYTLVDDHVKYVKSGFDEGQKPGFKDGRFDFKNTEKVIKDFAQIVGIPYQNAKKTVEALLLHAEDIQNGQFLSYEAGVKRTVKINVHRAWQAYDLGNTEDSAEILKSMRDSAVQDQLDKGKSKEEAQEQAYTNIRGAIKDQVQSEYLDAWDRYYHGNHDKDDYQQVLKITNFMKKSGVYENVDLTLVDWRKADALSRAKSDVLEEAKIKAGAAYEKAEIEGKDEDERKKKSESAARTAINKYVKDKYLKAYANNDRDEMNRLRNLMRDSGYYNYQNKSTDKGIDDLIDGWIETIK